jgi:hypothetical protein
MIALPTLAELESLSEGELADRYTAAMTSSASGDRDAAMLFRSELHHRETARRHAEQRRLLQAILAVSVVGLVLLAWDAID